MGHNNQHFALQLNTWSLKGKAKTQKEQRWWKIATRSNCIGEMKLEHRATKKKTRGCKHKMSQGKHLILRFSFGEI